jgi:N utilization substance protein A
VSVEITEEASASGENRGRAIVTVSPDQQSLAIGRGGQNVRLAAKLTGWKIDITSTAKDTEEESDVAEGAHEEAPSIPEGNEE